MKVKFVSKQLLQGITMYVMKCRADFSSLFFFFEGGGGGLTASWGAGYCLAGSGGRDMGETCKRTLN